MTITRDNFDDWLFLWGKEHGEGRPRDEVEGWDEGVGSSQFHASHPLARAQAFAPGTRAAVSNRQASRRDGSDRRRHMAAGLEECGVRVVGMAFVDAIACTETRPDLRTPRHVSRPQPAPEVMTLQRAILQMIEAAPQWGLALQVRYCTRGTPAERSARLSVLVGKTIKPRGYRTLVDQAKLVLMVKLGVV